MSIPVSDPHVTARLSPWGDGGWYVTVASARSDASASTALMLDIIRDLPIRERIYLPADKCWWVSAQGAATLRHYVHQIAEAMDASANQDTDKQAHP